MDQPRARITMIIVVIAMVTCSSFIEAYPSSCREGYHASYVGLGVTSRCQVRSVNGSYVQFTPKLVSRGYAGVAYNSSSRGPECARFQTDYHICSIPHCLTQPCKNGDCEETVTGYTCRCLSEFTGKNCEIPANLTAKPTTSTSADLTDITSQSIPFIDERLTSPRKMSTQKTRPATTYHERPPSAKTDARHASTAMSTTVKRSVVNEPTLASTVTPLTDTIFSSSAQSMTEKEDLIATSDLATTSEIDETSSLLSNISTATTTTMGEDRNASSPQPVTTDADIDYTVTTMTVYEDIDITSKTEAYNLSLLNVTTKSSQQQTSLQIGSEVFSTTVPSISERDIETTPSVTNRTTTHRDVEILTSLLTITAETDEITTDIIGTETEENSLSSTITIGTEMQTQTESPDDNNAMSTKPMLPDCVNRTSAQARVICDQRNTHLPMPHSDSYLLSLINDVRHHCGSGSGSSSHASGGSSAGDPEFYIWLDCSCCWLWILQQWTTVAFGDWLCGKPSQGNGVSFSSVYSGSDPTWETNNGVPGCMAAREVGGMLVFSSFPCALESRGYAVCVQDANNNY
ncbi:uncharacterized protein [Diadema antillarum]|uniref:uncharacterized protein n=1 Tax=Diadema antillarum TaxID=105358 RepID=UPI003A86C6BA